MSLMGFVDCVRRRCLPIADFFTLIGTDSVLRRVCSISTYGSLKFGRTANLSDDITHDVSATIPCLLFVIKRTNTCSFWAMTSIVHVSMIAFWYLSLLCNALYLNFRLFYEYYDAYNTYEHECCIYYYLCCILTITTYLWRLHFCHRSSSNTSFWLSLR